MRHKHRGWKLSNKNIFIELVGRGWPFIVLTRLLALVEGATPVNSVVRLNLVRLKNISNPEPSQLLRPGLWSSFYEGIPESLAKFSDSDRGKLKSLAYKRGSSIVAEDIARRVWMDAKEKAENLLSVDIADIHDYFLCHPVICTTLKKAYVGKWKHTDSIEECLESVPSPAKEADEEELKMIGRLYKCANELSKKWRISDDAEFFLDLLKLTRSISD